MPSIEAEIDVHFYELVHKLLGSDSAEDQPDRRYHPREPFSSIHRVAPYDRLNLPQPADFIGVCCHDLARGGFSYLTAIRPTSTHLIAAFGIPPDVNSMEARVVRSIDVLQYPSTGLVEEIGDPKGPVQYEGPNGEIGVPLILVSCKFIRRLKDTEDISWT